MAAITARVMDRDFGRIRHCKPHTARRMWSNFDRTYKLHIAEWKYDGLERRRKNTVMTELQCWPVWTEDDCFPGYVRTVQLPSTHEKRYRLNFLAV
jgi:hypothetical protein